MMDIYMITVMTASCALMKLFTDWCESQVDPKVKKRKLPELD